MNEHKCKRVSKAKLQQTIEDSTVEGWTLKSQNENIAILTKPGNWGAGIIHVLLFFLTSWWTLFVGNLLYALYAYWTTRSELQIKADLEEKN